MKKILTTAIMITIFTLGFSQNQTETIKLPEPQKEGGMALTEALNNRRTAREFDGKDLSLQEMSNLLWATFGINREENKKRTAPSAMNCQEIDIYVATSNGVYLYNAQTHELKLITQGDHRKSFGTQDFVKQSSIVFALIADYNKTRKEMDKQKRINYAFIDAGYISQNIYLFAAANNMATVALGSFDQNEIDKIIHLTSEQQIIITQPVGFQKK